MSPAYRLVGDPRFFACFATLLAKTMHIKITCIEILIIYTFKTAVFPSCHFEHPFASVRAITFSGAYGLPSHTVVAIDFLYSAWHENTFALTRSAGQGLAGRDHVLAPCTCPDWLFLGTGQIKLTSVLLFRHPLTLTLSVRQLVTA